MTTANDPVMNPAANIMLIAKTEVDRVRWCCVMALGYLKYWVVSTVDKRLRMG